PMLTPLATGAAARAFETHHNALDIKLYARIAPELYLKRLVVGGFEKVYELNRNFRNEGIDRLHNPEFTMLEFYWAYADVNQMMDLCEELLRSVVYTVTGHTHVRYGEREIDFSQQFQRFKDQEQQRQRGDEEAMPMDEDYIRALSYGMPPAAGIGVGIDRLVMLLANKHSIRDVILFPHLRPERRTEEENGQR